MRFKAIVGFAFLISCGKPDFERELPQVVTCCIDKMGNYICPPERCSDFVPFLKDEEGRYVYFHGVNVSGSTKFPLNEESCMLDPEKPCECLVEGGKFCRWRTSDGKPPRYAEKRSDDVMGKPFSLKMADKYFKQLRKLGFNSIRLLINWEGIMPESPNSVSTVYLDYIAEIVKKAGEHGIYVLLDMHQDAFSRYLIGYYNDRMSPIGRLLVDTIGAIERIREDEKRAKAIDSILRTFGVTLESLQELLEAAMMAVAFIPCRDDLLDIVVEIVASVMEMEKEDVERLLNTLERFLDVKFEIECKSIYNNATRGEGAPRWAVEAILHEKNLNSEFWGYPRILIGLRALADDPDLREKFINVVKWALDRMGEGVIPIEDVSEFLDKLLPEIMGKLIPELPDDILTDTTDVLPLTNWGLAIGLSLDIQRCFAALLAGRDVFPNLCVKDYGKPVSCADPEATEHIQDFLQNSFERAWLEVVKRVKGYPNVIGYDIINEPIGQFLLFTILGIYFQVSSKEGVANFLTTLFGDSEIAQDMTDILVGMKIFPDLSAGMNFDEIMELRRKWGLEYANIVGIVGLNWGFSQRYLQPFLEKIGGAIQNEDPDAIIWAEHALGTIEHLMSMLIGGEVGFLALPMRRPEGIKQVVLSAHWYTDVYPFPGFNVPPRDFTQEEIRFRDYKGGINSMIKAAWDSMGNIPVVLTEFGTYFKLINKKREREIKTCEESYLECVLKIAREEEYPIPAQILDNYFEASEELFLPRIMWCWSHENTPERGEGWNMEDFSIVEQIKEDECPECKDSPYVVLKGDGVYLKPRALEAYSRTHPMFISGKPASMYFWSHLHYFEPEKGRTNRYGEFELKFESKETDAPTEIFIPYHIYYPEGFYVWLSDGYAIYNHKTTTLYWYPTRDEPGYIHTICIRGPIEGQENVGWSYLFKDDMTIEGGNPISISSCEDTIKEITVE